VHTSTSSSYCHDAHPHHGPPFYTHTDTLTRAHAHIHKHTEARAHTGLQTCTQHTHNAEQAQTLKTLWIDTVEVCQLAS
jgi:hypothetical protein